MCLPVCPCAEMSHGTPSHACGEPPSTRAEPPSYTYTSSSRSFSAVDIARADAEEERRCESRCKRRDGCESRPPAWPLDESRLETRGAEDDCAERRDDGGGLRRAANAASAFDASGGAPSAPAVEPTGPAADLRPQSVPLQATVPAWAAGAVPASSATLSCVGARRVTPAVAIAAAAAASASAAAASASASAAASSAVAIAAAAAASASAAAAWASASAAASSAVADAAASSARLTSSAVSVAGGVGMGGGGMGGVGMGGVGIDSVASEADRRASVSR